MSDDEYTSWLRGWLEHCSDQITRITADRNRAIVAAVWSGISLSEVARRTGLHHRTVKRIVTEAGS